jgi:hypothetical protein
MDRRVIPDKLEHARLIGMALASVLSIQLSLEPEDKDLKGLCTRIKRNVKREPSSDPKFLLVVKVLKFIAKTPYSVSIIDYPRRPLFESIPKGLSTRCKLWLSRVMLETFWRWKRVQKSSTFITLGQIALFCEGLMADGGQTLVILKTNCVLIMAISLGLSVDIRDLHAPGTKYVLYLLFHGIH